MTRNISVPAAHETALESVLKKHNISYEKLPIKSSAIGLEKREGDHLMFFFQINDTIFYEITLEVYGLLSCVNA